MTSKVPGVSPRADRRQDLLASIVVFFVALPLCMGVSIACGAPPATGLIAGIVGGIIAGVFSGAPLQVSGPAAGLTVLVYELIEKHGLSVLGVVVIAAGLIQIAAGFLRVGRWFRAVSPAVIHGMLAGIGILITAGQFHVMFDGTPKGSGLPNLLAIANTVRDAFTVHPNHLWAAGLGLLTLAILFGWKALGLQKRLHMPGHLAAIAVATGVAYWLALPVNHVNVPTNLASAITPPTLDAFSRLIEAPILLAAVSLAMIASAESLLCANALDQLQTRYRTNYNRELFGQGVANAVSGALGGLPITGVIARSTVNVESGAQTRLSTILHGIWILLAVAFLPLVLAMVPTASLAALLIYTGIKLVDTKVIANLKQHGQSELMIYATTVCVIVATDLLTGVLVGMAVALSKLVLTISRLKVEVSQEKDVFVIHLSGSATFLGLPKLAQSLETIPQGANFRLDFSRLAFIDHSCLELLQNWEKRQIACTFADKPPVNWSDLMRRYNSPASHT